ncbi:acetyl-CoA acetyltransferase [Mycobacteroides abscessus subsp. bolletii]|uniref:Acetyl-CoA acetyltransferase n=1 Tax=Mycobacteroides abscessus subsp. massiliense TaxID=1962118 RepID=A0A1U3NPY9_9MYCO|nr:acetyl-CoA C-acetyltransferase [Mycobacteroides abscessus]EIV67507.1 monovalent cation/proton (H+) antiporter subunit D [Mycobacteroides abscessus subsp. massiliense CCUG 48898 = JCM 15300]MBL3748657.1 acetyl-CoA C-acetyltransferase [Mycobacteroides abscessus subsp. massiliense]MDM2645684.1 acetyl-CoA C-acetyltransferase [Mycobacteroides abscessus]MDM2656105.1 acetyl-CoA C-acetyltransferase [Mycobacteroides abscessus]MDM2664181.1 acetyl-CoA C-acetyltransferase [Mycobacteroides abscessus]
MTEAYIVDATRTPVGKRGGGLAGVHPADMAAHVIKTVVGRHDIDPAAIDDVILGCLDNIGAQAGDIARTAALAAGLPESVPGVTIDRQCGSAQQAVHFAAQAVMSGTADLIIAGGVQKMSQFPILCAFGAGEAYGSTDPWTGCEGWHERYGDQEISQFRGAELIARQWNLTREENEHFAFTSHQRALAAIADGRFTKEITPHAGISVDEGPRADTSLEKMAGLRTLVDGGVLTAAVASQISDGAAALLIASENAVKRFGLTPRARVHHLSALGADPVMLLTAPIPATQHALKRTGLSMDDIDLVEINEAFAPVVLAWLSELKADPAKVNPNGGAIALGHPIGCTGARLMTSLLYELERTGGRYGLQTMCEGGGQANVTILERL